MEGRGVGRERHSPSVSPLSLRKVRAMAIALSAVFVDCAPTTCSVGQSTHARACAAMSIAVSRGLLPLPTFVRLFPRLIRSKKVLDLHTARGGVTSVPPFATWCGVCAATWEVCVRACASACSMLVRRWWRHMCSVTRPSLSFPTPWFRSPRRLSSSSASSSLEKAIQISYRIAWCQAGGGGGGQILLCDPRAFLRRFFTMEVWQCCR